MIRPSVIMISPLVIIVVIGMLLVLLASILTAEKPKNIIQILKETMIDTEVNSSDYNRSFISFNDSLYIAKGRFDNDNFFEEFRIGKISRINRIYKSDTM